MNNPADDLKTIFRVFNEIGIIAQLSGNRLERALPHGMTVPQFTVLNHFVRLGNESTPLRLANAFQVTKGAMTNTLGHLERKGFVLIRPDAKDRRSKLVSISDQGREAHRACLEAVAPMLAKIAEEFPVEELGSVLPTLERLRVWLDEQRSR